MADDTNVWHEFLSLLESAPIEKVGADVSDFLKAVENDGMTAITKARPEFLKAVKAIEIYSSNEGHALHREVAGLLQRWIRLQVSADPNAPPQS